MDLKNKHHLLCFIITCLPARLRPIWCDCLSLTALSTLSFNFLHILTFCLNCLDHQSIHSPPEERFAHCNGQTQPAGPVVRFESGSLCERKDCLGQRASDMIHAETANQPPTLSILPKELQIFDQPTNLTKSAN